MEQTSPDTPNRTMAESTNDDDTNDAPPSIPPVTATPLKLLTWNLLGWKVEPPFEAPPTLGGGACAAIAPTPPEATFRVFEFHDGSRFMGRLQQAYAAAARGTALPVQRLNIPPGLQHARERFSMEVLKFCDKKTLHELLTNKPFQTLNEFDRYGQPPGAGSAANFQTYSTIRDWANNESTFRRTIDLDALHNLIDKKLPQLVDAMEAIDGWTPATYAMLRDRGTDYRPFLVHVMITAQLAMAAAQMTIFGPNDNQIDFKLAKAEFENRFGASRNMASAALECIQKQCRAKNPDVACFQEVTPSMCTFLDGLFPNHCRVNPPDPTSDAGTVLYVSKSRVRLIASFSLQDDASAPPSLLPSTPVMSRQYTDADHGSDGGGGGAADVPDGGNGCDVNVFGADFTNTFRSAFEQLRLDTPTCTAKPLSTKSNWHVALKDLQTGGHVQVVPLHLTSDGKQVPLALRTLDRMAAKNGGTTLVVGIGDFNNTEKTLATTEAAVAGTQLEVVPSIQHLTKKKHRVVTIQPKLELATSWSDGVATNGRVVEFEIFGRQTIMDSSTGPKDADELPYMPTLEYSFDHYAVMVTLQTTAV